MLNNSYDRLICQYFLFQRERERDTERGHCILQASSYDLFFGRYPSFKIIWSVSSLRCQSAEVQRSCNEKSSTFESVTSKCDPDTCHQPLIDSQDKTSLPSHYSKSGSPTHWSCQSGNLTTLPLPIIMWACERYIRYNPGL